MKDNEKLGTLTCVFLLFFVFGTLLQYDIPLLEVDIPDLIPSKVIEQKITITGDVSREFLEANKKDIEKDLASNLGVDAENVVITGFKKKDGRRRLLQSGWDIIYYVRVTEEQIETVQQDMVSQTFQENVIEEIKETLIEKEPDEAKKEKIRQIVAVFSVPSIVCNNNFVAVDGECVGCNSTQYAVKPISGSATECLACGSFEIRTGDLPVCDKCVEGYYLPGNCTRCIGVSSNGVQCKCNVHQEYRDGCVDCESNQYSNGFECINCPKGERDGSTGTSADCLGDRVICNDKQYLDGECKDLTVCKSNEYVSKAATPTTDRECTLLRVCQRGEYISKAATPTTDRECLICPDGFSGLNADTCTAWTTCKTNEYQSIAPTSTNDRECKTIDHKNESECFGRYTPATNISNSVCDECSNLQYESNNQCIDLTNCSRGSYVLNQHTLFSDRQCAPCNQSFSASINQPSCTPWTDCQKGKYIVKSATLTNDRQCEICTNGYTDAINQQSCKPWTTCSAGLEVSVVPTSTTDRECRVCNQSFSTSINQDRCTPWTDCQKGEYIVKNANLTNDRLCQPCTNGYTDAINQQSCKSWSTCLAGQRVVRQPDATKDRICENCPDKTYLENGVCVGWTNCIKSTGIVFGGNRSHDRRCEQCVQSFTNDTNQVCKAWSDCKEGTYIVQNASATQDRLCEVCPPKTYSTDNAYACDNHTICYKGTYISKNATSGLNKECSICPAGTYADKDDMYACKNCLIDNAINTTATSPGAQQCKALTCKAGYYLDNGKCTICAAGFYRSGPGTVCTAWTNADETTCIGGEWTAGSTTADSTCVLCTGMTYEKNNVCTTWTNTDETTCIGGEWKAGTNATDSTCTECDAEEYEVDNKCESWTNTDETTCIGGEWTAGTNATDSTCTECDATKYEVDNKCESWTNPDETTCIGGEWKAGTNATDSTCTECDAKEYEVDNKCESWTNTDETTCVGGEWKAGTNATDSTCTECDATQYEVKNECTSWTNPTKSTCVGGEWKAGTNATNSQCKECTGTTYDNGNTCHPWTYINESTCVGGEWRTGTNATNSQCNKCISNTYEVDNVCKVCAAGNETQKDNVFVNQGATQCKQCIDSYDHDKQSSTKCVDYLNTCPPGSHLLGGTYIDNKYCDYCPKNHFKKDHGSQPCQVCNGNTSEIQNYSHGLSTNGTHYTISHQNTSIGYNNEKRGATSCVACDQTNDFADGDPHTLCISNSTCPYGHRFVDTILTEYNECEVCSPGKYQHNDNHNIAQCYNCSKGTYSGSGKRECTSCPKGQYQDKEGQTFGKQGTPVCRYCDQNTYANQIGSISQSNCTACPLHQSASNGQPCQNCSAGKQRGSNDAVCDACPANEVSDQGTACQLCYGQLTLERIFINSGLKGSGSSREVSKEECKAYGKSLGKWKESGISSQDGFPKGCIEYFGSTVASRGIYYWEGTESVCGRDPNSFACLQKPITKYLNGDESCQGCPVGTYYSYNKCTVCPAGQYQNKTNQTSCVSCPSGTYLTDAATDATKHDALNDCSICAAGKYSDVGASVCAGCPAGTAIDYIFKGDGTAPTRVLNAKQCQEYGEAIKKWDDVTSLSDVPFGCFYDTGLGVVQYNSYETTTGCGGRNYCIETTASRHATIAACQNCTAGKYQNNQGQTSCTTYSVDKCPEGEGFIKGSTTIDAKCEVCVPGTSYNNADDKTACNTTLQPASCTVGEFYVQPTTKSPSECKSCPTGKFQNSTSHTSTSCTNYSTTECISGKYITPATAKVDRECKDCADETYSTGYIEVESPKPLTPTDTNYLTKEECRNLIDKDGYKGVSNTGVNTFEYCTNNFGDCKVPFGCSVWYKTATQEKLLYWNPHSNTANAQDCRWDTNSYCIQKTNLHSFESCISHTNANCPAGQKLVAGSPTADATCVNCPLGSYTASTNQTSCTVCAVGTYVAFAELEGQTQCHIKQCSANQYLHNNKCVDECPEGYVPNRDYGQLNVAYNGDTQQKCLKKHSGSMVSWGTQDAIAPTKISIGTAPTDSDIQSVYSTAYAFAALKADGSVKVWGDSSNGGTDPNITNGVKSILSTEKAFAALKNDGSVKAWGWSADGGTDPSIPSGVKNIFSNQFAFAALKVDGSIQVWGSPAHGGGADAPASTNKAFETIVSNNQAFAALKGGAVTAWGVDNYGGCNYDIAQSINTCVPYDLENVVKIFSTQHAFAALKKGGSVVAWGNLENGGCMGTDNSKTRTCVPSGLRDVVDIFSTKGAFAALKKNGDVQVWGYKDYGGEITTGNTTTTSVVNIVSTNYAFAALKSDGSIQSWGGDNCAGSRCTYNRITGSPSGNNYVKIFSNEYAFVALKSDGTTQAWGNPGGGGSSTGTDSLITNWNPNLDNVLDIFSTRAAFAALKKNGTIEVWGNIYQGGCTTTSDTKCLQTRPRGVLDIVASDYAFTAIQCSAGTYFEDGELKCKATFVVSQTECQNAKDTIKDQYEAMFPNLPKHTTEVKDWNYNSDKLPSGCMMHIDLSAVTFIRVFWNTNSANKDNPFASGTYGNDGEQTMALRICKYANGDVVLLNSPTARCDH